MGLTRMDAYLSKQADLSYSDERPVLIAGSSDAAMMRADEAIRACGARIGAKLPLDDALERIENQGSAAAIWIEIDRDCGAQMDELLRKVRDDVRDSRYGAVVSVTGPKEILPGLLDPFSDLFDDTAIELIANPNAVDRIAALATVTALRGGRSIADAAKDGNAERLRQLSEEVNRIAATLARLSAGPEASRRVLEVEPAADVPKLSAETVGNIIRARRLRGRFFSEELFADPAWDMLLDLLQAEIRQHRVPVSSLCIAAAVPATTALRWLKALVKEGVFVRRADPHDGRRVFVELAPDASLAMRRYFAEVGSVAII